MSKPISHKVEGDEFVVRIPSTFAGSVLFAIEGPVGVWPAGFFISQGVMAEIQPVVLNRLSGLHASQAANRLDLSQSQLSASAPETPKPDLPGDTQRSPQ